MATARREIVAWESRYLPPAGLVTLVASALIIASSFVASSISSNGHTSDLLISAHQHGGALFAYTALQAAGYLLLMAPLYVLFRATAARSDRFRRQLVGVVIAAPIFFVIASILTGTVTSSAADKFVNGEANGSMTAKEASTECRDELNDKGKDDFADEWDEGGPALANCEKTELEDDEAEDAISSQGIHGFSIGFEIASRLGFAVVLLYTCLMAMRVGLLSRFWGSLGMAFGVASLILSPIFALIFFVYFGILCLGKLPGGRPPAWAAGEAVPWPTPGERAAREMQPEDPSAEVIEAEELPSGSAEGSGPGEGSAADEAEGDSPRTESGDEPGEPGSKPPPNRRKRKRRN